MDIYNPEECVARIDKKYINGIRPRYKLLGNIWEI